MKVSCLQANLAKGLSIVSRTVASRSTLPVLGNVLLATDQGRLKIAATNLELAVTCWIGAKVDEDGATTVPARVLSDFVNSLPQEPINMELNTKTQTLHLKCARYDANIKGIDAQEFPIIPTIGDGKRCGGHVHLAITDHYVPVAAKPFDALVLMQIIVIGVEKIAVTQDKIDNRILFTDLICRRVATENIEYITSVVKACRHLAVAIIC